MRTRLGLRFLFLWWVAAVCAGCAGTRSCRVSTCELPCSVPVLFVADGAGDFQAASNSIRTVVRENALPLEVQTVSWSHGYARVFADQIGYQHARRQGLILARELQAFRFRCPQTPVYLLGHSAGCAVVLTAVEASPPGTVDRLVLFAPATSACYDLRPALRRLPDGIDVYYSPRDWGYLGIGTCIYGTTDRTWDPPAGRVGYRVPIDTDADEESLDRRLRQYRWDPDLNWTGNRGGHYGSYQPNFVRYVVLPRLLGDPAACGLPAH